ncbi:Uncharacterised protein [Bordetella pertussis]|nr:Uncharacterised protein [Bordetella pertussis]
MRGKCARALHRFVWRGRITSFPKLLVRLGRFWLDFPGF